MRSAAGGLPDRDISKVQAVRPAATLVSAGRADRLLHRSVIQPLRRVVEIRNSAVATNRLPDLSHLGATVLKGSLATCRRSATRRSPRRRVASLSRMPPCGGAENSPTATSAGSAFRGSG
jgi:hypothetical protein